MQCARSHSLPIPPRSTHQPYTAPQYTMSNLCYSYTHWNIVNEVLFLKPHGRMEGNGPANPLLSRGTDVSNQEHWNGKISSKMPSEFHDSQLPHSQGPAKPPASRIFCICTVSLCNCRAAVKSLHSFWNIVVASEIKERAICSGGEAVRAIC